MVKWSWAPDYLDPQSNADTFAHNDDDSDEANSHPLAWRNHWYIPDITAKMKTAAQGGRRRQAQGDVRGAAKAGDR
jgi:peptide/nickel transport system substrate-binding protein